MNQSLIKPGQFLSVFTDNLTSVSVPQGQIARGWETWGKLMHRMSMGNFTAFPLQAYEVLIYKPGSNRHYLGYVINIC